MLVYFYPCAVLRAAGVTESCDASSHTMRQTNVTDDERTLGKEASFYLWRRSISFCWYTRPAPFCSPIVYLYNQLSKALLVRNSDTQRNNIHFRRRKCNERGPHFISRTCMSLSLEPQAHYDEEIDDEETKIVDGELSVANRCVM